MRIDWVDGMTRLSVNFYDKGAAKSQVVVQHIKLTNSRAADQAKGYWKDQLSGLKTTLEG